MMALKPRMTDTELAEFSALLKGSARYLEYGCGGSTALAADLGVITITSVDSDKKWLDMVEAEIVKSVSTAGFQFTPIHSDIGPVGDWGYPKSSAQYKNFPDYALEPWRRSVQYDLVLVDGRFRLACAMAYVLFAPQQSVLCFHDFQDRPQYHAILKYVETVKIVDTMLVARKFTGGRGAQLQPMLLELLPALVIVD